MIQIEGIKSTLIKLAQQLIHFVSKKEVKFILTIIFTAAGLTFIGLKINESLPELGGYFENIKVGWTIASLPILFVTFMLFAYGWSLILRSMTTQFSLLKIIQIWAKAQLGKYIPGLGIHFVARLELSASEGITRRTAFLSTVIEISLLLVTAGIVALVALTNVTGSKSVAIFIDNISANYGGLYIAVLTIGFLIAILFINPIPVKWLGDKIGGVDTTKFTYRWLIWLIAFNIIRWIAMGVGFFMLAKAVYPIGYAEMPFVMGAFTLSWAVGLLVVFAPGGIGVREAMLVVLMEQVMPTGAAVALAALSRVWWVLGELFVLFFSTTALSFIKVNSLQSEKTNN
ncbi:MAG: lysylphosphatidylglycerol synthase domain-containing protein [Chloroflexota bacterium]